MFEMAVCTDCLFAVEYGVYTLEVDEVTRESIALALSENAADGYTLVSGGIDRDVTDEGHFSWSECELCGDGLGGTRYLVTAVTRTDRPSEFLPAPPAEIRLDA